MCILRLSRLIICVLPFLATLRANAEPGPTIELATHNQTTPRDSGKSLETIRKIVLNQGDDARAIANLVQLTRSLPPAATSRLYFELATDYLERGKYNQASNVLQQSLNQHSDQPSASDAALRLVYLFASSEVQHTEASNSTSQLDPTSQPEFAKYALHVANSAIRQIPELGEDSAFTFQRAVAMRLFGQQKAALGTLTRLKRNPAAEPWRSRALAEQWLSSDRSDDAPLSTILCRRAEQRPHLDGKLDESCWREGQATQLAYDSDFLYLAIKHPKQENVDYTPDSRARSYDSELSGHDRVTIRLDVDRDYATTFDLTLDHRGWTNDSCWLQQDWNPKWFVAAHSTNAHWSIEAALPLEAIVATAPQTRDAWTIATKRILPSESPASDDFRLLLFQ